MANLKTLGTLLVVLLAQACALDSTETSDVSTPVSQPPAKTVGSEPGEPRCDRLDDLGMAATGIVLHKDAGALDAPCVDLSGDRIVSFGGRACTPAEPTSFSLNGCLDAYDCGGCAVELRSDHDYGFVARGTSTDLACADIAGKYALVAGLACSARAGHL